MHPVRLRVLLVGTLALGMSVQPSPHVAPPLSVEEDDFWESFQWRMRYEDWRREHPGAARMLDQFEREINEQRKRLLPEEDSRRAR
jgi:hypothetical protein